MHVPPRKGTIALAGPCWGALGHHTRGFSWTHQRNICPGRLKCICSEGEMAWRTSHMSHDATLLPLQMPSSKNKILVAAVEVTYIPLLLLPKGSQVPQCLL